MLRELSMLQDVPIELVPIAYCSKLRSWKLCQRMKDQPIQIQANHIEKERDSAIEDQTALSYAQRHFLDEVEELRDVVRERRCACYATDIGPSSYDLCRYLGRTMNQTLFHVVKSRDVVLPQQRGRLSAARRVRKSGRPTHSCAPSQ